MFFPNTGPSSISYLHLLTVISAFFLVSRGEELTDQVSSSNNTITDTEIVSLTNVTNQRDSRQLFSLLKNLLRQPSQPQIQSKDPDPVYQQFSQQSFLPQNSYQMQNPFNEEKYPGSVYPASPGLASATQQKIHSANIHPGFIHRDQYPMHNYANQQHSSVPLYNDNLQVQQPDQSQIYQTVSNPTNAGGGGSNNPLFTLLSSVLGAGAGGGVGGGTTDSSAMVSSMLSKLGLGNPEDLDLFSLLNFGSIEGMLGRVNRFDKLQCIPRMLCQMVAKRNEDARIRATSTTTSTTTTEKSVKKSSKNKKKARFLNFDGVATSLDQFVKFLDLMQLKDWSLYPYVKGMTEGHSVTYPGDCAHRFSSCPFSEDQLVYYFNNYNGGFFQSFRAGRQFNSTRIGV